MLGYLKQLEDLKEGHEKSREIHLSDSNSYSQRASIVKKYDIVINAINECIQIFNETKNTVVSDIHFLLNLSQGWKENIPEGLTPMGYTTLSYEGDMIIKKRFNSITERYTISEDGEPVRSAKKGLKSWGDKLGAIE